MNNVKHITSPISKQVVKTLHAGDEVLLSGYIYTARDAGHKRLVQLVAENKPLPIQLTDAVIYYVGPTPEKEGQVIGSAGPTTSYRMDAYAPTLLALGQTGMIGKGTRNQDVIQSMKQNTAVYFTAIGGAAVVIAKSIIKSDIICYEDLGSEAIRRLEVKDMPLTVAIDCFGENLYEIGRQAYLNTL